MQAVVVREPGGPEVLEMRTLPDPEVPFGHVRVKVAYAGVNRADLLQRAGFYPAPPGVPKDIPGLEYSGAIDAVGAGVHARKVGERVFGLVAGGAYAENVVVHERETVRVPDGLSDEQAGAIPEAFVTAWDAMVAQAGLAPGESLLVHAAGSGVGTAAIQIGRAIGCQVLGTSRTKDKLERCGPLGLDHGILTADGKFADAVRAATSGRGADVILDLVGGPYAAENLDAARERARIVLVGLTAGRKATLDLGTLLRKRVSLVGTVLRARPLEEKIAAAHLLDRHLAPLFAKGALRPIVDRVYPLAEAGAAHAYVASDASFGKVLLRA